MEYHVAPFLHILAGAAWSKSDLMCPQPQPGKVESSLTKSTAIILQLIKS